MVDKIPESIVKKITTFFGSAPLDVTPIGSGLNSQAFSFFINKHKYALRISETDQGFISDKIIHELIPSKIIPTPKTFLIAKVEARFISVTEYCQGELMFNLDDGKKLSLLSEYLDISHRLHSFSVPSKNPGYGKIDQHGFGSYDQWPEYILDQKIVNSSFWPEDYFKHLKQLKTSFIKYLPSTRSIIHGDYGYKNIIENDGKICGIIDWSDALFGDFVYDIAYISFWSNSTDYEKLFFNYYLNKGTLNLQNFKERIHCYTLYVAILLLNYFAKNKDQNSFGWIKQKIDNYLYQNSVISKQSSF